MKTPNRNAYNDEEYASNASALNDAIEGLWESGASIENIESELANAMENATGCKHTADLDDVS